MEFPIFNLSKCQGGCSNFRREITRCVHTHKRSDHLLTDLTFLAYDKENTLHTNTLIAKLR